MTQTASAEALARLRAAADQLRKWRPPKPSSAVPAYSAPSLWRKLGGLRRTRTGGAVRKPSLGGATRAAVDDLLKRFPPPPEPRGALLRLGLLCALVAPQLLVADAGPPGAHPAASPAMVTQEGLVTLDSVL